MSSIQPQISKSNSCAPSRTLIAVSVILFTLIGGVFRFWNLAARDFWFDEACTYIYVKNLFDWQGGRSLLVESTNLPYYILLKGWVSLFGNSESCYRSLSAVAATLTVPLLAFIALRLGGFRAFVVAALITAFHPLHIYYASEARAYALWVMFLTLALLLLVEAVRRASWRWWVAYSAVALVATFTHYFTLFWFPASVFIVLLSEDRRRALIQWACATTAVLLLFLPYLVLAVLPAAGGGQAWVADHFASIGALLQTVWAFMPAGHYPAHLRGLSLDAPDTTQATHGPAALFVALVPVLMIAAIGLLQWRQSRSGSKVDQQGIRSNPTRRQSVPEGGTCSTQLWAGAFRFRSVLFVLAGLTFVPLLIAMTYSLIVRPIYLPGRYDLVAWPSFVLLISLMVAAIPEMEGLQRLGRAGRKMVGSDAVGLLLLCSLFVIARYARFRPPETVHHRRADVLAKQAGADDLVVAFNYDRAGMLYYLDRAQFRGSIISFPSWLDDQVGWVDSQSDLSPERRVAAMQDAKEIAGRMNKVVEANHRAFMLVDTVDPQRLSVRVLLDDLLLESALAQGLTPKLLDEELLIFEWTPYPATQGVGN